MSSISGSRGILLILSALPSVALIAGPASSAPLAGDENHAIPAGRAEAKLDAKSKSRASGLVEFEPTADGMRVTYSIVGLKPSKKHGFHLHQNGDCSDLAAKAAGGHFEKLGAGRGTSRDFPEEYAGDFPELQANQEGKARGEFMMPRLAMSGRFGILGRALVVHEGPDDVSRKAAARIACGVVKAVEEAPPKQTSALENQIQACVDTQATARAGTFGRRPGL